MYRITSMEVRQPQKAPSYAVIWVTGLDEPEIVNTTVGKPEEGMSVLTKQNLVGRFSKLYESLPSSTGKKQKFFTYMEAKESATEYNVSRICSLMLINMRYSWI